MSNQEPQTKPDGGASVSTAGLGGWVELNLPFGNVYGPGLVELDSFAKRGLNNPGVLVRMQDGSEYLIGDINKIRGVCDDCTEFSEEAIVSAYLVVWTPNDKLIRLSD